MKKNLSNTVNSLLVLAIVFMVSCSKERIDPTANDGSSENSEQENRSLKSSSEPLATFDLSLGAEATAEIIVPLMKDLPEGTDLLMTPNLSNGTVVVSTIPAPTTPNITFDFSCPVENAENCHKLADGWMDGCRLQSKRKLE